MLEDENRLRVLIGQLSTVGRSVRSTPMQWAYEGKKLDATVKHLSCVRPWLRCGDVPDEVPWSSIPGPGHLGRCRGRARGRAHTELLVDAELHIQCCL